MTLASSNSCDLEFESDLLPLDGDKLWNGPAPQALRDHYHTAADDDGWRRWKKHLARRRKPKPLAEQFSSRHSPLSWAWPDELAGDPPLADNPLGMATGAARLKGSAASEHWTHSAEAWLARTVAPTCSLTTALEALGWAYELPALSARLPAPLWWRLLSRLVSIAGDAGGIDLEAQPLANQLLAGELAVVLSYQFPELNPCHQLAAAGGAALSRGVTELLDGEGLPQCRWLGIFRPLLACWTRARTLAGKRLWDSETEKQFVHAVVEAVRLSRADGRQPLSNGTAGAWCPKLLRQALQIVDDSALSARARRLLPPTKRAAKQFGKPDVSAGVHGSWAELAVLQSGWNRGGPKLTVAYSDNSSRLELEFASQIIWSGEWQFELTQGDKAITLAAPWEENCWVSDDDVDYVEIEARLTDGFVLQRQIVLARKDRVLLLADAVIGPAATAAEPSSSGQRLSYAARLPLGDNIRVKPADETREAWLLGSKARVAVLPLALAEWRVDPRRGELLAEGNQLVLRQSTLGRNLYAPLFFDLDRKRARRGLTWRQLTIAEQRANLSPDLAVGYRAQSARDQWMIYRSLSATSQRTVLGQNLQTEFMFARFNPDGPARRLVEIE